MRGPSFGRGVMAALVLVCICAGSAAAQLLRLTIDSVPIELIDEGGRKKTVDLGEIRVTLSTRGGSGMSGVFQVAPEHRIGSGADALWEHMELHWINLIRADDCPATMRGIPAGDPRFPFPVVDMPRNGWDYVYRWRRSSRARGPERVVANADGIEMRDDARDIWPWYHTPEEERMEPDSGNATGGFGHFKPGELYGIRDLPSLCPRAGVTAFTSLLVAVVPEGRESPLPDSLQQGEILLLAGFEWDWTTAGARLEVAELSVFQLDSALRHSEFPEWMGALDRPVFVGTEVLEAIGARTRADQPAPVRPQPPRARPRPEPMPAPMPGGKPKL